MSDRSYPTRPFVAVGVVVLDGDHVLLIQRGKAPRAGQWSIPGGAQHVGELLSETAVREVKEEAGLDIEIGGLIEALDYIDRDDDAVVRHHYTLIDYWARGNRNTAPQSGEDAANARWVAIPELKGLPMWDETIRIIQKAAEMAR